MSKVKLELQYAGIEEKEIMEYKLRVDEIHKKLQEMAEDEKEFVGWLNLGTKYDKEEFERIKEAAKKIQEESEILIVLGIGANTKVLINWKK